MKLAPRKAALYPRARRPVNVTVAPAFHVKHAFQIWTLLPDAELLKDPFEHFFDVTPSGNSPKGRQSKAQVLGSKLRMSCLQGTLQSVTAILESAAVPGPSNHRCLTHTFEKAHCLRPQVVDQ